VGRYLVSITPRMCAPVLCAPMSGDSWNDGIRIAGRSEPPAKEDSSAGWARAMPGFFETIGAKMAMGRPFTERTRISCFAALTHDHGCGSL
jgi:hypothetical protein